MKKIDFVILLTILLVALAFRLYKINTPLADLHSWRQVDTAAVARNFVKDGIDLMNPRFDDLSSSQSGLENPKGYRFVEFPFYNALFAYLYKLYPAIALEIYGRATTIFFSLIIISVIYYLVLHEENRFIAIASSTIYAVFPFFVFFSRVVLPETTALSFALLAILLLYISYKKNKLLIQVSLFIISILCFAVGLLVKPTAFFYILPILFIFIKKYSFDVIKKPQLYFYSIASVIPILLWRLYIQSYPEGIPANLWLITGVNTYEGLKPIFFKPAFFRWIFYERMSNVIFGGYLSAFFLLGVISKPKRYFLYSLLLAATIYLFTFQGGNVQHEYYQTLLLPALAIFVGRGLVFIERHRNLFIQPLLTYGIVIVFFVASFFFSFYRVKEYYHYPSDLIQIANIMKTLTKEEDKIVTDRQGDTTLLYLSNRRGAPSIYKDPSQLKKLGYSHLVTQNKDYIKNLKSEAKYSVIFENDKFAIFKL